MGARWPRAFVDVRGGAMRSHWACACCACATDLLGQCRFRPAGGPITFQLVRCVPVFSLQACYIDRRLLILTQVADIEQTGPLWISIRLGLSQHRQV